MIGILKPCPFCGGEKLDGGRDEFGGMVTYCSNCGSHGPSSEADISQVLEAWNTRAAPKVKPLVFEYPFGRSSGEITARTQFNACYSINERGPVFEVVFRASHMIFGVGRYPVTDGVEAAKAAAQADYERRILGALA